MRILSIYGKMHRLSVFRRGFTEIAKKDFFIEKLRQGFELDESKHLVVPVFKKAMLFPDHIAIKDLSTEYTYFQLYMSAKKLSFQISNICGGASLSHVAYLCSNNILWVISQWACWISGQIAIPLEPSNSQNQLKFIIDDCKPKLIISSSEHEELAHNISDHLENAFLTVDNSFVPSMESLSASYAKQVITTDGCILTESTLPNSFYAKEDAMLLYTAGSFDTQKSVVLTYRNIDAQMKQLIHSWKLSPLDSMLHLIPTNSIHSAVNGLLSVGGSAVLHQQFDCHNAWSAILGINNPLKQRINIFLAMPITYKRLIAEYDKMFSKDSRMMEYIINHCKHHFRLMASIFAPLPESVFYRWRDITGQNLLEYYGMLESGIVLGNPVLENCGDINYRPGTVGFPLTGVKAKLISFENNELINHKTEISNDISPDELTEPVINKSKNHLSEKNNSPVATNIVGELWLAGENIFKKYLKQDKSEEDMFQDEYFKTRDIFAYQNGYFKFLGKYNDIITVGGYKVFSSEIKKVLFTHPSIKDVAVLGIPSKIWGQRLGVICILSSNNDMDLESIKNYCYDQLPFYKRPTVFKTINK